MVWAGKNAAERLLTCRWHHPEKKTWLGEQRCGDAPGVWMHMFTSLCSQSPSACPRWLVLCFEFEALHVCQRACQLLYLLDVIKVFFYCISVLFTGLEIVVLLLTCSQGTFKKNTPLMQTLCEAERQKKKWGTGEIPRGAEKTALWSETVFFLFDFRCRSSASLRLYGFNRHVFTRPLNLKCEPRVCGNLNSDRFAKR